MKRQLLSIILILAIVAAQFAGSGWVHPTRAAGPVCYVDDTATGLNDGSSWANAFTDLQSALGDTGCTRIEVAAGTYYPSAADMTVSFELRSGVAIYGGYPDGGAQTPDPETYAAVLSGNIGDPSPYDNTFHVVHGENVDQSAVLDGFTIQDGRAQGPWIPAPLIPSDRGGGLYIENSNPTLRNLHINSNSAWMGGGGMYLLNSSPSLENVDFWLNQFVDTGDNPIKRGGGLWIDGDSSPQLTNVNVTNNQAEYGGGLYCSGGGSTPIQMHNVNVEWNQLGDDSKGGGIYLDGCAMTMEGGSIVSNAADDGGGIWSSGHVSLTDVDFSRNLARAGDGGGLYSEGTATLERVTFYLNYAYHWGGGMSIASPSGSVQLLSTQFVNNHADASGGGLWVGTGTTATIRSSQFRNNTADSAGGGLFCVGSTFMTDCLVDGNSAGGSGGGLTVDVGTLPSVFTNLSVTNNHAVTNGYGGGIHCVGGPSTPSFTNLLLSGNSARWGGGMAILYSSEPHIVNATVYGNYASAFGSAIYSYLAGPTVYNSIVWGNGEGMEGPDIFNHTALSYSTIAASILEDGSCPEYGICSDLAYGDPLFADAANGDYRLTPASAAIDAGNTSALPADTYDLDGDGNTTEPVSLDLRGERRVVWGRVDMGAYEAQVWNVNWAEAAHLPLVEVEPGVQSVTVDRYLDSAGQSRWFKFSVQPDSKVIVTLTGLPANYDLALYRDIAEAYTALESSQDLVRIGAEFAPDTFSPDTFSPDTFSPDTFSPDTFSPDTFSPDTFSPDTFSPDTFSPDTFSPDTFSPDTFSPDTFSPDTFSPDTFSPDTFSPDTFSPDTFSPDTFSPDTFSGAQTRSLVAVSAHEGTLGEGILINTWLQSGDFYVRVRGRYGASDADNPFRLQVMMLTGACGSVSPLLPPSNTAVVDGDYATLILENPGMTAGSAADKALLETNLAALAARSNGWRVNVGADDRVSAASAQAEANPSCVYAKNLEAAAVEEIITAYRAVNPLQYIVLVGNDRAIPFFRYADLSLLASEIEYSPPVLDNSTSQASLRSGYILSQDGYGSTIDVPFQSGAMPLPDLPVGRLVETAADINAQLQAYLADADGIVPVGNALVTGYDFLADDADAVQGELTASLGASAVETLIMDPALSPEDPAAWTASDLRTYLLGSRHDLVFLAGHFSANSAVAADGQTRMTTAELQGSATNMVNCLVYSAGCHSGYNIVNDHDVPNVTEEPDWPQAFAAKGATFIGGTGYQYGDTEFIEYSERLYLELTRQLRYGSTPVAIGQALVKAKQAYLAGTPLMRGLHEKTVLEATLFGLPMLQFALPGHIPEPVDTSLVSSTTPLATDPGQTLGLRVADLSLSPALSEQTLTLNVIATGGGTPGQVQASYLQGPDGVVVNAAEPVLPLDMVNVTAPAADYVLRGVGWRGGAYTDLPDRLPLTGAATEDLRAPHPAFFSDVFYPPRPWNVNYYDALRSGGGPIRLAWIPAQYRSSTPGSLTGTLRRFDTVDFRLYYSANISAYASSDPGWINVPALAAPPDVPAITSTVDEVADTVAFEVTVTGDPAAGIQEAWIVYTFDSGATSGLWLPLDLQQDAVDSRRWSGTLHLGDASAADLRFVVQAVNGVGLVTMMTNSGAYYRAGVNPGAPPPARMPVTLALEAPATSGQYGDQATFRAEVTTLDDTGASIPLAGAAIAFSLGGQERLAVSDGDGQATASFFLLAQPDEYTLTAAFAGSETHDPASASTSFEILPGTSVVALEPTEQHVPYSVSPQFVATVTSAGLPLTGKPVALTLDDSNGVRLYTSVAVTDYAGRARWQVPPQSIGSYTVKAWFGLPVTTELDLSSPFYTGSVDTATLVVGPFAFSGFFSPVDNPPVCNRAKAGSAVPVTFGLGGYFGLDIFAGGYPRFERTNCQVATVDTIEQTVSADASRLAYDSVTGRYTYVWKTDKKWAGACGSLVLMFVDGTTRTALFQFTK